MKQKKEEQRALWIVKDNSLIQKSRYSLTLVEQKIILRLIQMIKPEDGDLTLYEFNIGEFCQICGMDYDNGKNYINIKSAIKKLADKSYWITLDDGRETLVRWIEKPYINKRSGIVQIKLDEMMKPYLLQLKEQYTQYRMIYIIVMKSTYSIRFYELLKSYEKIREKEFIIDSLKKQFMCENYERFVDFKRFVIEPAINEINEVSDILVEYELVKKGRSYYKIKFHIRSKSIQESLMSYQEIERRLNSSNDK